MIPRILVLRFGDSKSIGKQKNFFLHDDFSVCVISVAMETGTLLTFDLIHGCCPPRNRPERGLVSLDYNQRYCIKAQTNNASSRRLLRIRNPTPQRPNKIRQTRPTRNPLPKSRSE